jgi:hypothetical protein
MAEGIDPASRVIMRHAGKDYDALRSTVGRGGQADGHGKRPCPDLQALEAAFPRTEGGSIGGNGVEPYWTPAPGEDTPVSNARLILVETIRLHSEGPLHAA